MDPAGKRPRIVRREAVGIGDNSSGPGYLDGQLLIAMPVMGDPRFERSVIYLCAHSSEGAMGIIVNRPAGSIDFPELLVQLDIIEKADQIKLPENAETMKVLKGGPVETGRGFVLHSSDFFIKDATPIRIWCSAATSRKNTCGRCARSGSTRACCRTKPGMCSCCVVPARTRGPITPKLILTATFAPSRLSAAFDSIREDTAYRSPRSRGR